MSRYLNKCSVPVVVSPEPEMARVVLALLFIITVVSAKKDQTRWSRQISTYTSDISDWVPLQGPELSQFKRQAVAEPRVLSEPFAGFTRPTGFSAEDFQSRAFYTAPVNRHLYVQSIPSASQNYLSEQGFNQGMRLGLTQPNYPLSQGFIAPQFSFDGIPQFKARPQIVSNPIKFDNSPKVKVPAPNPVKQFAIQSPNLKSEAPKFVDGYRLENNSSNYLWKKPQSLQKIKFETDKSKEVLGSAKNNLEREEVQLLYVPLESLNRGQFNFRSPLTSPQILNTELYNQHTRTNTASQNIGSELQSSIMKQLENFNSQEYMNNYNNPIQEIDPIARFSTTTTPSPSTSPTTPKPKKLKPHQPPLAIFLTQNGKQDDKIKVGDVLYSLKNADTVAVLDSVNPLNAPSVFIGPASLTPPEHFVKFELPYLSNIENSDKKLRQLPFFVAPLSYNTPQGFAKIPFPAPHVGSVVINSQMKETSSKAIPTPEVYTNSFSRPTIYRQEQKPATQKPVISYYSTSTPSVNSPNYEQNYYSIEPQSVNSLPTPKEPEPKFVTQQPAPIKTGSYFLNNVGNQQPYNQYNQQQYVNFPQESNFKTPEPPRTVRVYKTESVTSPRTTVSTTTQTPTYSSQLLETHNPYSINQAFSLSTPLDYHNFFDEYKETYATTSPDQSPPASQIPENVEPASGSPKTPEQQILNEESHQSSPSPVQGHQQMSFYAPEIHNLPENHNLRYPVFNTNYYSTKTETPPETSYTNAAEQSNGNTQEINNFQTNKEYSNQFESESPPSGNYSYTSSTNEESLPEEIQTQKVAPSYNQYDINNDSHETISLDSSRTSTTSSTTTTRRTTLRSRNRPRYSSPKPDYNDYSTRSTITRRPLRERKPLPSRPRYEPNKITTERQTRKPIDPIESTTKSSRSRTRGRIQFKPSDSDEIFIKRNKQGSTEQDLAYQRDVLHQNYPVTLMERTSTTDIEAITEPTYTANIPNNQQNHKIEDTADAYSSDKISITDNVNEELKDPVPQYTTAEDSQTGASYVPKTPNREEDFSYQHKTSEFPQEAASPLEEENQEEASPQKYTEHNPQQDDNFGATNPITSVTEQNVQNENQESENQTEKSEEFITQNENEENTKSHNHELNPEQEQEENIIETTPSYNRVRIRPGVVRKYHQGLSESSKNNVDRRKPQQAITYRPAFDRRRTTMRIEEIEADLKTKQIHSRPGFQDYRQPVYKPEPSTELSSTSTTEATKREDLMKRKIGLEVGDRLRNPQKNQTRKVIYQRLLYSSRPRFSERYNKNTEEPTAEDQDSNYSITIPRYVEANTNEDSNRWSPKISQDSFKPFNPNNIADETKIATEKSKDEELDIITAKNEYEDILISVTPATNNRLNKKLPDIPPTLEAFVEQSKISKSDSSEAASTFETMLEEVMKSLEEQDENEYTNKVMKHKGGEIGEIPPEIIISSGENYSIKTTTPSPEETTSSLQDTSASNNENLDGRKSRRRGFWKKVKVRPVSESIDVAESQYYSKIVNHLGQTVSKEPLEKNGKGNTKVVVTTYKPNYEFLKDFFESEEDHDNIPDIEITKIIENNTEKIKNVTTKTDFIERTTERMNPGEIDLGTGAPDRTFADSSVYTEATEPTTKSINRSDGFNFMNYLFGTTSSDEESNNNSKIKNEDVKTTIQMQSDTETEVAKIKTTTENVYMPDEFTADSTRNGDAVFVTEKLPYEIDLKVTERDLEQPESSSQSSFMNPANVLSTSMSTEISHETEICFRGKCIKTNKNVLL
ncbi:hypothetical protein KGM_212653 [Danaus plexippus plexippus]|uniref:Uncharacterized protein n=1 Tax=Danaus plexippus plexippus TaxID=278856 RepID=A0A212FHE8_DANPL|nr:hypothetical protein KGM_212653 [Danaus plexippus plexippus]